MQQILEQDEVQAAVRTHAGWVYSCAKRRVGDAALAEDVTQAVFILFWRKRAELKGQTKLTGWLYRAVSYCAANALRLKEIRQRHEKEAGMTACNQNAAGEVTWDEISPELELAVDRLREKYRSAVLLRYYRQMSLAEVGQSLGISEEAARKRVSRALEMLRGKLASKGVSAGAAALGMVMTEKVTAAAPAGVMNSVAGAVGGAGNQTVAGAIAKGAMKMMMWMKVKVAAVVCCTILLVAGIVVAAQPTKVQAPTVKATPKPGLVTATQPSLRPLPRARFIMRETRPDKSVKVSQVLWEEPDRIRAEALLPDGSIDPNAVPFIASGGRAVSAYSLSKLYLVTEEEGLMGGKIKMLALFASIADPGGDTASPAITMKWANEGATPSRLQPRGQEMADGQSLRVFELLRVTDEGDQPFMGQQRVLLCFDDKGECKRIVFGSDPQRSEISVDRNPVIAADTFELKGPPGYTDVTQGVFPRLDPAIRAVADRYYQAREGIMQYRMVVYPSQDKAYPRYRNVRDGERWRLDELDLGAMIRDKEAFPRGDKKQLEPRELRQILEEACRAEMEVRLVVMAYEGQLAQLGFNYSTQDGGQQVRAGWIVPPLNAVVWGDPEKQKRTVEQRLKTRWYRQAPKSLVGEVADYDLRELGWPAWMGDVLVAPHGWDLGTPPPVYYRLPDQADRAGLIGIRAVAQRTLRDLWIDPAKDYLCMSRSEIYDRREPWKSDPMNWDAARYYAAHKPDERVDRSSRVIEEYGKTPEGKWYPVRFGGGARVVLDTSERPDPALFDWPAGAPKPGN